MPPEEIDRALTGHEQEQLAALFKLSQSGDFQAWRDLVVLPQVTALESQLLTNASQFSEVELRARLMHLASLKYLFTTIFDTTREVMRQQNQQTEHNQT